MEKKMKLIKKIVGFVILVLLVILVLKLFVFKKEKNISSETKKEILPEKVVSQMVELPGTDLLILSTEVTQQLFESVMDLNPSHIKGNDYPVTNVSWNDAIYFCNKKSINENLEPVYSINGVSDIYKWNYKPCSNQNLKGKVEQNVNAKGYRLPLKSEWEYAAEGNELFMYPGSDDFDEVAWHHDNSHDKLNFVGLKKKNGFGLYDMSGNVWEWCWDNASNGKNKKIAKGGCYGFYFHACRISYNGAFDKNSSENTFGFRIVCKKKDN